MKVSEPPGQGMEVTGPPDICTSSLLLLPPVRGAMSGVANAIVDLANIVNIVNYRSEVPCLVKQMCSLFYS